jgi:hypothetical protein
MRRWTARASVSNSNLLKVERDDLGAHKRLTFQITVFDSLRRDAGRQQRLFRKRLARHEPVVLEPGEPVLEARQGERFADSLQALLYVRQFVFALRDTGAQRDRFLQELPYLLKGFLVGDLGCHGYLAVTGAHQSLLFFGHSR